MNFSEFLQPAIFALTGKPGAGKSYFATRCIIAEITKGQNRTIVTNVPINRQKLREYVKKDFNLYDLETFTDNRFFFSNRGHYNLTIDNASENLDFGQVLQKDDEGVLYIIDEAHLYFNARNWKHMMGATLSYITFIRHIGDTCVYMCQKFSDIDSQFRGKTQAFHLLRNLDKERFGMFKRGSGFRCYQYLEESHIASHGSTVQNAVQDFTYPFKLQIAECYNTSLFNKGHDKKYKVTGIKLNHALGVLVLLVCCFLYWIYQGGIMNIFNSATDSILLKSENQSSELETNSSISTQYVTKSNFNYTETSIPEDLLYIEIPSYSFPSENKEGYQQVNEKLAVTKNNIYFGDSVQTSLSFFSDKDSSDNRKSAGFDLYWGKFAEANTNHFSTSSGLFNLSTPVFKGFLSYVKDKSFGISHKETEVILKENVPFTLKHGFQIPQTQTFASQGIVQTSRSYQQVGFEITLVFEKIEQTNFLKIDVINSDVLDISAESPILQTFQASNVLDVLLGKTYLIADFNSQTHQKQKGFLKTSNYESSINNKIFLSFGTN
jgi:hypothetical protein